MKEKRELSQDDRDKINNLRKQEKYDEIYFLYGTDIYKKNTPRSIQRELLKKLEKEGRYEEIYLRFGEREGNRSSEKAMYREIRQTKGIGKEMLLRLRNIIKAVSIFLAVSIPLLPPSTIAISNTMKTENAEKYQEEIIEQYQNNLAYADEIRNMNLTDLETIELVIEDLWKNIEGYKQPEKEFFGFPELSLSQDGYGVCRNITSQFSKIMNLINPQFNARNVVLDLRFTSCPKMVDIKRNILESSETVSNSTQTVINQNNSLSDYFAKLISGNHAATLLDIPNTNTTLYVDPTNLLIGVINDREVVLLNDVVGDYSLILKKYATEISGMDTLSSDFSINGFTNSYLKGGISLESLKEMYGSNAQQIALDLARTKREIYKSQKMSFDERIKVDDSKFKTFAHTEDDKTGQIIKEDDNTR